MCPLFTEPAKVERRAAEWRWDCGAVGPEVCLWCTLHIFFLFLLLHHANTQSVRAIHLHTEGGGRPPAHAAHCERWPTSLKSRTMSYRLFGSTRKCSGLWDEMSDDGVTSHLDRDGVKLRDTHDSRHVAVLLTHICEWGDFCVCIENWS